MNLLAVAYKATYVPADDNVVPIYLIYGIVSVGLTVWLARVLYQNGKTFLHDVFDDRPDMGDAVNHLLVTGFFMLNLGYAFLILRAEPTFSTEEAVALMVNRLGLLLVSLGIIHFINMAVFWKIRRRTQMDALPPPVPPQIVLGPTPPPPYPGTHVYDVEADEDVNADYEAPGRDPWAARHRVR